MKSLIIAFFLLLSSETSFAKEKPSYTISSDTQINTLKGDLEAIGNVVIKNNNNDFEASSNKLTFLKDAKSLKLIGNVVVKNLDFEDLLIKESYGDELIIFSDTGFFEFTAQKSKRVKTKIKF